MSQTVFIRLPYPLAPLHLSLRPATRLADIRLPDSLAISSTFLRTRSSAPLDPHTTLSDLSHDGSRHPIDLELGVRVLGGKGGFGSQLRAAGGRMSTGKATNVDACRDLSGRRLSTIKEAQRQAELLESAPAIHAAAVAADKAKLEALERSLGISAPDSDKGEGSSSSSTTTKRLAEVDLEELARKKHRFDDNGYMEESREINDNVRNAVVAGLLKKKKKKTATTESTVGPTTTASTAKSAAETANKAEQDKVAMPPPPVAKTAAVA